MNLPAVLPAPPLDERFLDDVLRGLSRPSKALPCQWFYDFAGSQLFEEITRLPEYYLTRAEIALLEVCASDIARHVGAGAAVVEFGSGSSRKTPLLLSALKDVGRYVPVDIAADFLAEAAAALKAQMPALSINPVVADLNEAACEHVIRRALPAHGERLGVFLGSSIGNFTHADGEALLARFASALGAQSWLLVGVDSTRDPKVLIPAYDDAAGVTARFNLNVLTRINNELGGQFKLTAFGHEACFYPDRDRVEMHLVSRARQRVRVADHEFEFVAGERIHTENCHKLTVEQFHGMARNAGWRSVARWGARNGFGLFLLRREY